ncbi:hypothetical protein D9M71_592040 [compost metagenome]
MPLGIDLPFWIDQLDPQHQTAPADITQLRKNLLQAAQVGHQALAHGLGVSAQVMSLEVIDHRRTRSHGHLVTAEGAGVGARLPGVEPLAIDHHRQRQAAADGFGQHHHIRSDASVLESEHLASTGKATLDFVDDQRYTGFFSDAPHTA